MTDRHIDISFETHADDHGLLQLAEKVAALQDSLASLNGISAPNRKLNTYAKNLKEIAAGLSTVASKGGKARDQIDGINTAFDYGLPTLKQYRAEMTKLANAFTKMQTALQGTEGSARGIRQFNTALGQAERASRSYEQSLDHLEGRTDGLVANMARMTNATREATREQSRAMREVDSIMKRVTTPFGQPPSAQNRRVFAADQLLGKDLDEIRRDLDEFSRSYSQMINKITSGENRLRAMDTGGLVPDARARREALSYFSEVERSAKTTLRSINDLTDRGLDQFAQKLQQNRQLMSQNIGRMQRDIDRLHELQAPSSDIEKANQELENMERIYREIGRTYDAWEREIADAHQSLDRLAQSARAMEDRAKADRRALYDEIEVISKRNQAFKEMNRVINDSLRRDDQLESSMDGIRRKMEQAIAVHDELIQKTRLGQQALAQIAQVDKKSGTTTINEGARRAALSYFNEVLSKAKALQTTLTTFGVNNFDNVTRGLERQTRAMRDALAEQERVVARLQSQGAQQVEIDDATRQLAAMREAFAPLIRHVEQWTTALREARQMTDLLSGEMRGFEQNAHDQIRAVDAQVAQIKELTRAQQENLRATQAADKAHEQQWRGTAKASAQVFIDQFKEQERAAKEAERQAAALAKQIARESEEARKHVERLTKEYQQLVQSLNLGRLGSSAFQGVTNAIERMANSMREFRQSASQAFGVAGNVVSQFTASTRGALSGLDSILRKAGAAFTNFGATVRSSLGASTRSMQEFYAAGWSLLMSGQMMAGTGMMWGRSLAQEFDQYLDYERLRTLAAVATAVPTYGTLTSEDGSTYTAPVAYQANPELIEDMIFAIQRGTIRDAQGQQMSPVYEFDAKTLAQGIYYYGSAIGQPITPENYAQVAQALMPILQMASFTMTTPETAIKGVLNMGMEFGLDPRDMENADEFAKIAAQVGYLANISTMEVPDIVESFKMVGPMAHILSPGGAGSGLEETMVLTFLASEMGLRGTQVGRGLNQALTSLLDPTDKLTELASQIFGIENSDEAFKDFFMDAEGNLKGGLMGLVQTLADAAQNGQSRNAAELLASMFTTNATRQMITAVEQMIKDPERVDQIMKEISGEAPQRFLNEALLATNDTLIGNLQNLKNAFFGIESEIVNSIQEPLKRIFKGIADLFWDFADFLNENPEFGQLIAKIAAAGAAFLTFLGVLLTVSGSILVTARAFSMLGAAGQPVLLLLTAIPKILLTGLPIFALLAGAVVALKAAFDHNFLGMRDAVMSVTSDIPGFIKERLIPALQSLGDFLQLTGAAFEEFVTGIVMGLDDGRMTKSLYTWLEQVFGAFSAQRIYILLRSFGDALDGIRSQIAGFFSGLGDWASGFSHLHETFMYFVDQLLWGVDTIHREGADAFGDAFGIDDFSDKIAHATDLIREFIAAGLGIAGVVRTSLMGSPQTDQSMAPVQGIMTNIDQIFQPGLIDQAIAFGGNVAEGFVVGFNSAFVTVANTIEWVTGIFANFGKIGAQVSDVTRELLGFSVTLEGVAHLIGGAVGAALGGLLIGRFARIIPLFTQISKLALSAGTAIATLGVAFAGTTAKVALLVARLVVAGATIAAQVVAYTAYGAILATVSAAKLGLTLVTTADTAVTLQNTAAKLAQAGALGGVAAAAVAAAASFAPLLAGMGAMLLVGTGTATIFVAIAGAITAFAAVLLVGVAATDGMSAAMSALRELLSGVADGFMAIVGPVASAVSAILSFAAALGSLGAQFLNAITFGNGFQTLGVVIGASLGLATTALVTMAAVMTGQVLVAIVQLEAHLLRLAVTMSGTLLRSIWQLTIAMVQMVVTGIMSAVSGIMALLPLLAAQALALAQVAAGWLAALAPMALVIGQVLLVGAAIAGLIYIIAQLFDISWDDLRSAWESLGTVVDWLADKWNAVFAAIKAGVDWVTSALDDNSPPPPAPTGDYYTDRRAQIEHQMEEWAYQQPQRIVDYDNPDAQVDYYREAFLVSQSEPYIIDGSTVYMDPIERLEYERQHQIGAFAPGAPPYDPVTGTPISLAPSGSSSSGAGTISTSSGAPSQDEVEESFLGQMSGFFADIWNSDAVQDLLEPLGLSGMSIEQLQGMTFDEVMALDGVAAKFDTLSTEDLSMLPPEMQQYWRDVQAWKAYQSLVERLGEDKAADVWKLNTGLEAPTEEPQLGEYIDQELVELAEKQDELDQRVKELNDSASQIFQNLSFEGVMKGLFSAPLGRGTSFGEALAGNFDTIQQALKDQGATYDAFEFFMDAQNLGMQVNGIDLQDAILNDKGLQHHAWENGVDLQAIADAMPKYYFDEAYLPMAQGELLSWKDQFGYATHFNPLTGQTEELFNTLDDLGIADGMSGMGIDWSHLAQYAVSQAAVGQDWNLADFLVQEWDMSKAAAEEYIRNNGLDPSVISDATFGDLDMAMLVGSGVDVLTAEWATWLDGVAGGLDGMTISLSESEFWNLPEWVRIALSNMGYHFELFNDNMGDIAAHAGDNVKAFEEKYGTAAENLERVGQHVNEAGEVILEFKDTVTGEIIEIPAVEYQKYLDSLKELEKHTTAAQRWFEEARKALEEAGLHAGTSSSQGTLGGRAGIDLEGPDGQGYYSGADATNAPPIPGAPTVDDSITYGQQVGEGFVSGVQQSLSSSTELDSQFKQLGITLSNQILMGFTQGFAGTDGTAGFASQIRSLFLAGTATDQGGAMQTAFFVAGKEQAAQFILGFQTGLSTNSELFSGGLQTALTALFGGQSGSESGSGPMTTLGKQFATDFKNAFTTELGTVAEGSADYESTGREIGAKLVNGIKSGISDRQNDLSQLIFQSFHATEQGPGLSPAWTEGQTIGADLAAGVKSGLENAEALQGLSTTIQNAINAASPDGEEGATTFTTLGTTLANNLITGLTTTLNEKSGEVATALSNALNTQAEGEDHPATFGVGQTIGTQVIAGFVDQINNSEALQSLASAFANALTGVSSGAEGDGGGLAQAGTTVATNLISGFTTAMASPENTALIASAITNAINPQVAGDGSTSINILGINVGFNLLSGIAQGMTQNAYMITNAFNTLLGYDEGGQGIAYSIGFAFGQILANGIIAGIQSVDIAGAISAATSSATAASPDGPPPGLPGFDSGDMGEAGWYNAGFSGAQGLVRGVNDGLVGLNETFSIPLTTASTTVSTQMTTLATTTQTNATAITTAFGATAMETSGNFNKLDGDVSSAMNRISGSMRTGMEDGRIAMRAAAQGGRNEVQAILGNWSLYGPGYAIGLTFSQGLAAGIRAAIPAIQAAAAEAVAAADWSTRRAAGVHSPSKLFAAIGEEFPRGLAVGIHNSTASAVAAMADVVTSLSLVTANAHPSVDLYPREAPQTVTGPDDAFVISQLRVISDEIRNDRSLPRVTPVNYTTTTTHDGPAIVIENMHVHDSVDVQEVFDEFDREMGRRNALQTRGMYAEDFKRFPLE